MTSVEKYIPPERMTEAQIMDEVDREFRRWNLLADGGCQDPGWPDGVNMNLVRNHIIYWYGLLDERGLVEVQLSLFPGEEVARDRRPIPPEVPDNYMVAGCEHSHRLDKFRWDDKLVWGKKGEYSA